MVPMALTRNVRCVFQPVLRIRIHMFLGLPDPEPLVRGRDPDPDPFIIMQNSKKNLDSYYFVRGMDPRIWIRIHTKMSWIRNTAFNALCFPYFFAALFPTQE
jgi:hypothetical protein